MEAILRELDKEDASEAKSELNAELQNALRALSEACNGVAAELGSAAAASSAAVQESADVSNVINNVIDATWLVKQCSRVESPLGLDVLAHSVLEAAELQDEASQQMTLFELFGDDSIEVLMEIIPQLATIRTSIAKADLDAAINMLSQGRGLSRQPQSQADVEMERRQLLLDLAIEAAHVAAVAEAQVHHLRHPSIGGTHTVSRTSDKKLLKEADKAAKKSAQARQRAIDAGAMIDDTTNLLSLDPSAVLEHGPGGLMSLFSPESGLSAQDIYANLQEQLAPEGTREYHERLGLPRGAIRETTEDGLMKVLIPAVQRNEELLPRRLPLADILDPEALPVFRGTLSLNAMQSVVFPAAYHRRDNLVRRVITKNRLPATHVHLTRLCILCFVHFYF
jgi:hypothetical protein